MAKLKDFYGELGVAPNSEDFVIQAAYRAMLRRYHPDVNRSPDASQKTIRINEAYKVLSDPETRARYDRALKASQKAKDSANAKSSNGSSSSSQRKERPKAEEAAPPPPPVEPVYAGPLATAPDPSWGGKAFLLLFGVAAFLFLIYAAGHTAPSVAQVDDNLDTPMNVFEDAAENMAADVVPASLGTQDAPEIDFGTIEGAAKKYSKIVLSTGVLGARQYSEKCHAAAVETPTWTAFDQCAAFDYAAAHIDETVSGPTGTKNSYFQFQTDNMQRFYTSAGAAPSALFTRLSDIEKYAGQAAEEAVEAEIAKQNAAEEAKRVREQADIDARLAGTENTAAASANPPDTNAPTYVAPNGEVRRD